MILRGVHCTRFFRQLLKRNGLVGQGERQLSLLIASSAVVVLLERHHHRQSNIQQLVITNKLADAVFGAALVMLAELDDPVLEAALIIAETNEVLVRYLNRQSTRHVSPTYIEKVRSEI